MVGLRISLLPADSHLLLGNLRVAKGRSQSTKSVVARRLLSSRTCGTFCMRLDSKSAVEDQTGGHLLAPEKGFQEIPRGKEPASRHLVGGPKGVSPHARPE